MVVRGGGANRLVINCRQQIKRGRRKSEYDQEGKKEEEQKKKKKKSKGRRTFRLDANNHFGYGREESFYHVKHKDPQRSGLT